jgi:hypothetical protein
MSAPGCRTDAANALHGRTPSRSPRLLPLHAPSIKIFAHSTSLLTFYRTKSLTKRIYAKGRLDNYPRGAALGPPRALQSPLAIPAGLERAAL